LIFIVWLSIDDGLHSIKNIKFKRALFEYTIYRCLNNCHR
jgi:hypothetical protein